MQDLTFIFYFNSNLLECYVFIGIKIDCLVNNTYTDTEREIKNTSMRIAGLNRCLVMII